MPQAQRALHRVFSQLAQRLTLTEQTGAARGPWLSVSAQGGTRCHMHCYSGLGVDKVVHLTLADGDQLDAAMLLAFGAPESALPHLLLDVAHVGREYVVFVDLLPRVDLAVHGPYVAAVYAPLSPVLESLRKHPKLKPSTVPFTLGPFASPWMAGFRCGEALLPQLFELVAPFVSTWLALQSGELPPVRVSGAELAGRDLLSRAALFSPEADPVWDVIGSVVGSVHVAGMLELLQSHGVPRFPSGHPPG